VPLNMSRQEREEFLAGVHVGVLSVAPDDDGSPLASRSGTSIGQAARSM
jgi:hypothetical protein